MVFVMSGVFVKLRSSIFELDRSIQQLVSKLYLAEEGNPLIRVLSYLEQLYLEEVSLSRSAGEAFRKECDEEGSPASQNENHTCKESGCIISTKKVVEVDKPQIKMVDMEVQCSLGVIEPQAKDCQRQEGMSVDKKKFFQTAAGLDASSKVKL